jgi:dolichol-phosphate mannosyltransferase
MQMTLEPVKPVTDELARIEVLAGISIVIPTYKEVENIPLILERIDQLRRMHGLTIEVIFADDNSQDGSVEAVEASGFDWARILVRTEDRGLSQAVIEGFRNARHPILVCMDCDLSHPVDVIPQMVLALATGQQFVLGSRYVPGGSTDDDWGIFRYLNSRVATWLARPLTRVKDPMSGFFALRRADFERAEELNPVGYKVALEIIVKCGFENVAEVPIHFSDRALGESKLTLREQLKYIKHLRRLYIHKFANAMYFLQFLVVGASGVVVNLSTLTVLQLMGLADAICLAGGIATSVVTNFLLNRRFTFSYARDRNIWKQFAGFVTVSSLGIAVNYGVALGVAGSALAQGRFGLHLSALAGIACGMLFNYIGNRYVIFRKTHLR